MAERLIDVPGSKSILIRLLLIESFSQGPLVFFGQNSCQDVLLCRKALRDLERGEESLDCGASAALLRFFAFRVSRKPGRYRLRGTSRLFERGHKELVEALRMLGVQAELKKEELVVESSGWIQPERPLQISAEFSSQVLSGLLLSSWNLEFDLDLELPDQIVSRSYLLMTLELLRFFEMPLHKLHERAVRIPCKIAPVQRSALIVEPDMSSAFSIAAFAALTGVLGIQNFPHRSLQGDFVFPALLKRMGVALERKGEDLWIYGPTKDLKGLSFDFTNTPDLFPVLASLAAFAESPSVFTGLAQLQHKESDRVSKTAELLECVGVKVERGPQEFRVLPGFSKSSSAARVFDCENDHRLAMAASLFLSRGFPLKLKGPECVDKSFPDFWKAIGMNPEAFVS